MANTDAFFVVALDALGNGVSSLPDTPFTIGDRVAVQHRLVTEQLGLQHAAAVMGCSMGGTQTLEWMIRYPDFMDCAVPIAGSPQMTTTDRAAHQPEMDLVAAAYGTTLDEAALQRVLTGLHVRNIFHPDFFATLDEAGLRATVDEWLVAGNSDRFKPAHWRAQWEAMFAYHAEAGAADLAELGAAVQARVLAVTCIEDFCVDPVPLQQFAAAIPGAQTLELAGSAGHLNFFTEIETLTDAVTEFLANGG